jgi:hypothetical protein
LFRRRRLAHLTTLTQEGVSRLIAISFSDLNLALLDHVRLDWLQDFLLEKAELLLSILLEGNKGKPSAPPRLLVPHNRHVNYLAKL